MNADALLDSNVLIAAITAGHEHHAASLKLFMLERRANFAIAGHSYAEVYNTLTRQGDRAPFHYSPEKAWAALESVRTETALVGLSAAQTFDATRGFSLNGGIGARLYDKLIGQVAVNLGIPVIVTWNVGHMRSLFPDMAVKTPSEFVREW